MNNSLQFGPDPPGLLEVLEGGGIIVSSTMQVTPVDFLEPWLISVTASHQTMNSWKTQTLTEFSAILPLHLPARGLCQGKTPRQPYKLQNGGRWEASSPSYPTHFESRLFAGISSITKRSDRRKEEEDSYIQVFSYERRMYVWFLRNECVNSLRKVEFRFEISWRLFIDFVSR